MAITIKQMTVGEVMTNCYLVMNPDSHEMVIIDPGGAADRLLSQADAMGGDVQAILLTHGHFDHILAAERLRNTYHCRIFAEEHEKALLEDPVKNLTGMLGAGSGLILHADEFLHDQEERSFAGYKVRVMHTPGHTAGGCCYYFPEERVLFSGDTLFAGSCGRTDFPTASMMDMRESLRRLLTELPEDVVVYPGHDRSTTIGDEKRYNPYAPR
jgi:hydroxyacylglutathione hydrolase